MRGRGGADPRGVLKRRGDELDRRLERRELGVRQQRGLQRGGHQRSEPLDDEGRHADLRAAAAPRTRSTRATRTTPGRSNFNQAVGDAAGHLQVLPRRLRQHAGARHRDQPRPGQRQRPGVDLPHQAGPEVRGRLAGHRRRTSSTRSSAPTTGPCWPTARPTSRSCWRTRSTPARTRTRTGDLTSDHHAGRVHDPVPPAGAVPGLQLRGGAAADRPGAAGQGHRRQLPAAPACPPGLTCSRATS